MAAQEFTTQELENEEWRSVVGYEGLYEVSSLGRIKSWVTRGSHGGVILKSGKQPRAHYPNISLLKPPSRKKRSVRVHVLVAEAFIGPRPEGLTVNHIDGVKHNARASNLEYITQKENAAHAIRTGLWNPSKPKQDRGGRRRGETVPWSKLTSNDVIEIRRQLLAGKTGRAIAREFHVSSMLISSIRRGRIWGHIEPLREDVKITLS